MSGTKRVDVLGETCPVPLVETRKAIRKSSPGDIIDVVGNHPESKEEISMAVDELGLELLDIEEEGGNWTVKIKIPEDR